MAAMAPLIGPLDYARASAPPLLPQVLLQQHQGRDVHFYRDLGRDQLVVLDLVYAHRAAPELFMYALSRQPGLARPAELRRYIDRYGAGDPHSVQLLRWKLGWYNLDAPPAP